MVSPALSARLLVCIAVIGAVLAMHGATAHAAAHPARPAPDVAGLASGHTPDADHGHDQGRGHAHAQDHDHVQGHDHGRDHGDRPCRTCAHDAAALCALFLAVRGLGAARLGPSGLVAGPSPLRPRGSVWTPDPPVPRVPFVSIPD